MSENEMLHVAIVAAGVALLGPIYRKLQQKLQSKAAFSAGWTFGLFKHITRRTPK